MTYQEATDYLNRFVNYEQKLSYNYRQSLKLERVADFLKRLGSPQQGLNCLHIAGSKGKGSTCAFLAYILKEAGFKVGLYTSPHLKDFRERIRLLNYTEAADYWQGEFEGMILEERLAQLVKEMKPAIDKYNSVSRYGSLSFFEIYTAIAFQYFKEEEADFVVLETGLGGRLDATNTARPVVCGITPISLEHTQKLGSTLAEIATEKAGIIKKGLRTAVVSAPQKKEVREVIRQRCKDAGVGLLEVGRDILYERVGFATLDAGGSRKFKEGVQRFSLKGVREEYAGLEIKLLGRHQVVNACVSVGIVEQLKGQGISVSDEAVRKGLLNSVWPGRCEIVFESPYIVLDGAQNRASCRALKEAIREHFRFRRLILILGASQDKDIKGIVGELKDMASEFILTRSRNVRATRPEEFQRYLDSDKVPIVTHSVEEAIEAALSLAEKDDLVLISGSLFVVAEAREFVKRKRLFSITYKNSPQRYAEYV